MYCQNCQKRPANIHFTQIVNQNKVVLHLCEKCAAEKGKMNLGIPFGISSFFSGLMGFEDSMTYEQERDPLEICQQCGMSYEDFKKLGKMGCAHCYTTFGDRLLPILKRLHGNTEHSGKTPIKRSHLLRTSKEIDKLKALLGKAIQKEEYEKAAQLRDEIKALESI